MKKLYIIGMTFILLFAISMIAYGAWLNKSGENQIEESMKKRTVTLHGAKAQMREINPKIVLETVNLYSQDMVDAVALIDGRIEELFINKNSFVRRGQKICTLVNEDIPLKVQQAESSIARAEAQLANANSTYVRYTQLMEYDAVSVEKLDEAKANLLASKAALQEAIATRDQVLVQSARQEVTAPLDGEVLLLYRQQGAHVDSGTPLALIGDFSKLYFSMVVEDKNTRGLEEGSQAELQFTNDQIFSKAYDTKYAAGNRGRSQIFPVIIKEIVPSLNEPANLRKIIWEVDNRAKILEQQTYSGVTLKSSQRQKVLTVPLTAMIDSNRDSVLSVTSEGFLERRLVQTGADDGQWIEILSGLNEGEVVITSVAEGLEIGTKVTVSLAD